MLRYVQTEHSIFEYSIQLVQKTIIIAFTVAKALRKNS
jgi:hypothetical protein